MNSTQTNNSVYTDYPVWKPDQPAAPAGGHKLSPRAKAGIGAGGVVLAATGMFAWSQYEAAQAQAEVAKARIGLEQTQADVALQQAQAQAAKASGQETPAQVARREALEKCIATAADSYNGVAQCASAYPVIDPAGSLGTSQAAASTSSAAGAKSGAGLVVLGATGAVVAVGWVKKKLAR